MYAFPTLTQFVAAKESYERVLAENPAHAKVLQQLGGLYHRSKAPFYNPELSVSIITKSLESGRALFISLSLSLARKELATDRWEM